MDFPEWVPTLDDLDYKVATLVDKNARHRRRDIRLGECSIEQIYLHLIEEAVEVAGEATAADRAHLLAEEAGDLLGCLLHLLQVRRVPLKNVLVRAWEKLEEVFDVGE